LSSEQSVLNDHQKQNQMPKAPALVTSQCSSTPALAPTPPPAPTPPLPNSSDFRNTLDAYPPHWREVITNAKKSFHTYLAGTDGFPNAAEAVAEARSCLEDALEVFHEEGGSVEPSKCNLLDDMFIS
jgi:hypothetical protein